MLAIRVAISDPTSASARAAFLEDHKAYLRSAPIHIVMSGPVKDERGLQIGAMIVAEVDELKEMVGFSAEDPFVKRGVYGNVSIYEWTMTIDNRGASG